MRYLLDYKYELEMRVLLFLLLLLLLLTGYYFRYDQYLRVGQTLLGNGELSPRRVHMLNSLKGFLFQPCSLVHFAVWRVIKHPVQFSPPFLRPSFGICFHCAAFARSYQAP